mmetsp:Transcript_84755/g.117067  ORF Transcript_84755/g.117067 Transcript_84755/m.117067 type:complete len:218 (-) Transcript_84755:108-761(-)
MIEDLGRHPAPSAHADGHASVHGLLRGRARQAKVRDLGERLLLLGPNVLHEEDVAALQIPVQDAWFLLVQVPHAGSHVREDLHPLPRGQRQLPVVQLVKQAAAGTELADDEVGRVHGAVEALDDVRVVRQEGQGLPIPVERSQVRAQPLHRHDDRAGAGRKLSGPNGLVHVRLRASPQFLVELDLAGLHCEELGQTDLLPGRADRTGCRMVRAFGEL